MYIYWCNWLQSFVTRESAFILFFSSPVLRDWKQQEGKNLLCIIIIIVVVAWEKWRPFTTSLLLLDSVGFLFVSDSLPSTKAVSTYLQPRNFLVFQNFKATLNIIIDNNINQFLVKISTGLRGLKTMKRYFFLTVVLLPFLGGRGVMFLCIITVTL